MLDSVTRRVWNKWKIQKFWIELDSVISYASNNKFSHSRCYITLCIGNLTSSRVSHQIKYRARLRLAGKYVSKKGKGSHECRVPTCGFNLSMKFLSALLYLHELWKITGMWYGSSNIMHLYSSENSLLLKDKHYKIRPFKGFTAEK